PTGFKTDSFSFDSDSGTLPTCVSLAIVETSSRFQFRLSANFLTYVGPSDQWLGRLRKKSHRPLESTAGGIPVSSSGPSTPSFQHGLLESRWTWMSPEHPCESGCRLSMPA